MPEQPSIEAKYRELKRRDPGCILLFRVSEVAYMARGEDAEALQSIPGVPPLWGIPGGAMCLAAGRLAGALAAIVAAGRSVAVVEPHAGPDPRGAEVERVVTPGEGDDEFTLRERACTEGEGGGR